jgi:NTE family protein
MDIGTPPRDAQQSPGKDRRPDDFQHVALVLQGGGALGAYQGGVYEALHEAGMEPDWVAGVSIGGINSAIIAGNPPERRLPRLREFWELITSRKLGIPPMDGDAMRKARNSWSAMLTTLQGQPGFFSINSPGPWFTPRGGKQATAFYDTAPLRETLLRLVDFDLINSKQMRLALGSVNVESGNFVYFDNFTADGIVPEHIMASGALPPALPMVRLGTDWFWDGGLVSNTPLQHVLDNIGDENAVIFQVDLFSAHGSVPRDMYDVLARQKDIQYSSRTRLTTDRYLEQFRQNKLIHSLLERVPDADLSDEERALKKKLSRQPSVALLHLIYQQAAYEGDAKDYEFSGTSMREHWSAGYRDTQRTLRHKSWLRLPTDSSGIAMHDIHRYEE